MLDASLFDLDADAGTSARLSAATNSSSGRGLTLDTLDPEAVEQQVIAHALHISEGNRTRAAALLGLDVRTLRRKLNTSVEAAAPPASDDAVDPTTG